MSAPYAVLSFLSAALLFTVQPLYGRLAMPVLGGAPQVWATTLVFFQCALLGGYAYAHGLQRLRPRVQAPLHLLVIASGALLLPLQLRTLGPPDADAPASWLLATLALSVGLPFVALAAHAPLLQRWFATRHPGSDPYPLYVASNAGSLAGLLAYPFLLEPTMTLGEQSRTWTIGYGLLAAGLAALAVGLHRAATAPAVATSPIGPERRVVTSSPDSDPSDREASRTSWTAWLAYAAVPSALLVAVTTQITTDFAALPMMWVPPLALYLVTFMIAFAARPPIPQRLALRLGVAGTLGLATTTYAVPTHAALLHTAFVVICFFAVALALHGELVRRRPPPARLTNFYLVMAAGGALGGSATALVPPLVLEQTHERPVLVLLALVLIAAACRRESGRDTGRGVVAWLAGRRAGLAADVAFAVLCAGLAASFIVASIEYTGLLQVAFVVPAALLLALVTFTARDRPLRAATAIVAVLIAAGGWRVVSDTGTIWRGRSFYGQYRVIERPDRRSLSHGTTLHGAQSRYDFARRVPLTYYGPTSGAGRVLADSPAHAVGVVGLGTGAMACWARPGQQWTFFEIDPLIVHVARDTGLFTYLRECAPDARFVLGDARLTLARQQEGSFDVLAVDAFSSDAIPLHLLTAEAFTLYRSRLSATGVLLVHVSNRHLDLVPVVAAIAKAQRWMLRVNEDPTPKERPGLYFTSSTWLWLARAGTPEPGSTKDGWTAWPADRATPRVWTDDYANPLAALKRRP
jgi:hypothetical protein